jgi:hypothetical protein
VSRGQNHRMFNFLRQSWRRIVPGNCLAAGARKGRIGAGFECLESRCLLSLAPPAVEFLVPPIEFPSPSILPYYPPDEGGHGGDWPKAPQPHEEPPKDWEEPSSEGGPIDIGELDNTSPENYSGEGEVAQEEQAVLDLLLSLSIQPRTAESGIVGSKEDLPHDMELDVPVTSHWAAGAERASDAAIEGGMVALVRGPSIVEGDAAEPALGEEARMLLETPVRMDNSYGTFQAFEVSKTERGSSDAARPAAKGNVQPEPFDVTSEPRLTPNSEPAEEVQEQPGAAGDRPVADGEPTAAEHPISTEQPCASDEKTTQTWNAAAIALLVAIVARVRRRFVTGKLESGFGE